MSKQHKTKKNQSLGTMERSVVMSVFETDAQAQKAMDDLQRAGISPDQMRYSVRKSGTGITDSLEKLGLADQEATFYNDEFQAGHTVVMVNAGDRRQEVYDMLRRDGGYDFNTRSGRMSGYNATEAGYTDGEQAVKLREEQLHVQKQPVERGEASLHKDVVAEQQSMDVPVSHEEVYLERRPGTGQPTDTPIGEDETYRVPVREEQVTVEKQPVVREEVKIGKRKVQDTQQVSDTVRREEAHVESSGDVNIAGTDEEDTTG